MYMYISKLKRSLKIPLSILLLTLIDQYIKIYISNNLMNENFYIFNDIFGFVPSLNTSYSWFNSLFNLGVGLLPHIVVNIIVLFISILLFDFIRKKQKDDKIINLLFTLLFAGVICSLIDKIFWGGSLDYIYLKGLFTFDLKDFYLSIFQIALISCWLFNYKGFRKTKRINRNLSLIKIRTIYKEKVRN